MSGVYFHAKNAQVRLAGSERAYAARLTTDLGTAILRSLIRWEDSRQILAGMLNARYSLDTEDRIALFLNCVNGDEKVELEDGSVALWSTLLNTCLRIGSGPVRLLTRMHAQCEIHLWIDHKNLDWLGSLIQEGLRDKVLREDMGWDRVLALLVEAESDVVLSYSVCDSFPNELVAEFDAPDDEDAWWNLPAEQRWDMAMSKLRESGSLELKPENFATYGFGRGKTSFDIVDEVRRRQRVRNELEA